MTSSLTELQAVILEALSRFLSKPDHFRSRKELHLADTQGSAQGLKQLKSLGLVEDQKLGVRLVGWRLTDAGREMLPQAHVVLAQAKQQRHESWKKNYVVYGVERPEGAEPLTPQQQRAWMRGFAQAQIETMALPADAPAEVVANQAALRAWLMRLVGPSTPTS